METGDKVQKRLIKQISIKFGFPEEEFIKLSPHDSFIT